MSSPLRTVLIEEHHEAFYVWEFARRHGWISPEPAFLLHVDEHRDMILPVLRHSVPDAQSSLNEIARFTYGELGINTFIWGGVLAGLIDRIFWLRVQHDRLAGGWRRIGIHPRTANGLSFRTTAMSDFSPMPPGCLKTVEYAPVTVETPQPPPPANCILDIDLDYFCWNDYPEMGSCSVDVTEDTYREFCSDRYHFLRLFLNAKVGAASKPQGGYTLRFQDIPRPVPKVTSSEVVAARVDAFLDYLERWKVRPSLAVICRSRHTGWIQSAHADFVEQAILRGLERLYSLECDTIGALLRGHFHDSDVFAPNLSQPRTGGSPHV